jgi:hypothetical protein
MLNCDRSFSRFYSVFSKVAEKFYYLGTGRSPHSRTDPKFGLICYAWIFLVGFCSKMAIAAKSAIFSLKILLKSTKIAAVPLPYSLRRSSGRSRAPDA